MTAAPDTNRGCRMLMHRSPNRYTCSPSLLILPAILFIALLTSCAPPPSHRDLIRWLAPDIPEDRLQDLRLTAFLAQPGDRRAMHTADDVVAWLDSYWLERDPTPGTPENEALAVYRQRAAYLQRRFPDTPFGEWPDIWSLFLQYGLPDSRGPEHPPWRLRQVLHLTQRIWVEAWCLRYGSPWAFTFSFVPGNPPRATGFRKPPRKPPSMEDVWETLENPGSSMARRQRALTYISWYELPEIAERLLNIPANHFSDMADLRAQAFRRLAVRSSYLLQQNEIRRLAALIAAGGSPDTVLRRAASLHYPTRQLRLDLDVIRVLRSQLPHLERMPNRGPHIELWENPEQLFIELARNFPSDDRLTGWDWRGDLYLAYGAPAHLNPGQRVAYYTWGTPEALGIGQTMMGWVQTARMEDTLRNFIDIAAEEVRTRKKQGRSAAAALATALHDDSGERGAPTRELMLEQLHVLAPPPVYQVGIPLRLRTLPITMDAVAFPTEGDSMEVQASFGIPTDAVLIHEEEGRYTTNLRTRFTLIDHELNVIHSTTRHKGYMIEGKPDTEDLFLLDTFKFKTVPGSYIAYLSAEDPESETSGGALLSLDLASYGTDELQVSPILLATDIQPTEGSGKFVRGGSRILPAPSRYLLFGHDLFFYFEISNLTESQFHDYVWHESYYIIPHSPEEGIIKITHEHDYSRLQPRATRDMQIDLSSLEATYEGPIFLVVLVTDLTSHKQAIGVTLFNLRRPDN